MHYNRQIRDMKTSNQLQQSENEMQDKILKSNAEDLLLEDSDPGEIIGRDKQVNQLNKVAFHKILKDEDPVSVFYMYGTSGSGKTYIVDKLREGVERKVDPTKVSLQYINGRRHNTYYQVLVKMWNNLSKFMPVTVEGDTYNKVKKRGFAANEIHKVLREIITENNLTVQVTLDEIDKMRDADAQELISTFYDMHKDGLSVQIIGISNDPYQTTNFKKDIKRRISYEMHVPKYNAVQLNKILKKFADLSLKEGTWDEGALNQIAANIGSTSGSASEAKKLLYHTAIKSEGILDTEEFNNACQEVSKNMIKNEVVSRPKHDRATLQAVARLDSESEWTKNVNRKYDKARNNGPTTANVYELYKKLCEKYNLDEKSKKTVSRMLQNLVDDEILSSDTRSGGRGSGVSTFWEPLHESSIIEQTVEETLMEEFRGEEE